MPKACKVPTHWRDGLLEHQSATCPRLTDLKPALGFRRVIDPRSPALLLQAPVCLWPGWRFVGILNPMDQRGLITPLWEPGHNSAVHPGAHKRAHGSLVAPHCAGPESPIGIAKERNRNVPSRKLSLARRPKGLDHEPRQVPPSPHPEPRDGHEGHSLGLNLHVAATGEDRQRTRQQGGDDEPVDFLIDEVEPRRGVIGY